jgi:hypothetical protein
MNKALFTAVAIVGLVATANAGVTQDTANLSSDLTADSAQGFKLTGQSIDNVIVQPIKATANGAKLVIIKMGKATANDAEYTYENGLQPLGAGTTQGAVDVSTGISKAGQSVGQATVDSATWSYQRILTPVGHLSMDAGNATADTGTFTYKEVLTPIGHGAKYLVVNAKDAAVFLGTETANGVEATWQTVLVPLRVTKDGIVAAVVNTDKFISAVGNASVDLSAASVDGSAQTINGTAEASGSSVRLRTDRAATREAQRKALQGN